MPTEFKPRDYQQAGIDLMLAAQPLAGAKHALEGCGLFLEPGSGKTVTTLTAADILLNERWAVQKTLVIAPKMVAQEVWAREAAKWHHTQHLKMFLLDAAVFEYYQKVTTSAVRGTETREIVENHMTLEDEEFLFLADVAISRTELLPAAPSKTKDLILRRPEQIHIVSRDHLYVLARLLGKDWPYDLVIGDESTMWKNRESKRTKAISWLRHEELVRQIALLSGTPSPKGLENLFNQAKILDGGRRLGAGITKFRERFMVPDSRNREGRIFSWKARQGATGQVTELLQDICLSVRADAWRETDPPRVVERMVTMPGPVRELYAQLSEEFHLTVDGSSVSAPQAAVLGNKLIQIASGAVFDDEKRYHVLHDAKLDALDELIEELDGEPLVIVYWFKPTLARLKQRYGANLATVKTKGFLDRFARGELPLLALQPGGAGHGLDGLQDGGHHVAVVDLFHDWELYQQVVSRLDRSGQKKQVTVHQILAAGTKDRQVARVLADRGADQGHVMDALLWRK